MDGLLEGALVVEEIFERNECLSRRAAILLNYVKGEYEDQDGDLATGFIIADAPPSLESRFDNKSSSNRGGRSELPSNRRNNSRLHDRSCNGCEKPFLAGETDCGSEAPRFSGAGFLPTGNAARPELRNSNDVVFLSDTDDEGASFFCNLCEESACLDSISSMLSCTCLICITCVQLHVVSLLTEATQQEGNNVKESRFAKESTNAMTGETEQLDWSKDLQGTQMESERVQSRPQLEWIPCPKPSCSGRISLAASQMLAPEAFRVWEDAANETLFEENANFVKCPGCKVVIEKVTGVVPPGVALTGVPELDHTAPFIELDNEGHQLSRSAMCHKAVNRFCCKMCFMDFCGLCMMCPYHLGKSCEEVEGENNSTK